MKISWITDILLIRVFKKFFLYFLSNLPRRQQFCVLLESLIVLYVDFTMVLILKESHVFLP